MTRTRILHVMPSLAPYGAERTAAILALGMDPGRFQVGVVSLFEEQSESLAHSLTDNGIEVFHLDKQHGLDMRMFGRIHRVLKQVRPHIVHTNNYVLRYTLPPCLLANVPVMVHTLQNVAERESDQFGRWLQRWAFRGRVHPVSIAEKVSESYKQIYGLPRPTLIPNAIDVGLYAQGRATRAEWRRKEGFAPDDLLYVCVARLFAQKNHRMLLDAFAAGPARLPEAKLLLAGDGGLQAELEAQAERLKIRDRVFFLGRREDVVALLGAADVFALASLWEGNPLSVMEAMAAGIPVVVTAVGGVPELVEHGQSGFIAESGNTEAFASALLNVARDSAVLRSLGAAAAKRARDKFDHRQMVQAYDELYGKLLLSSDRGMSDVSRAA